MSPSLVTFLPSRLSCWTFNWKFVKDFRSSSDWKGVKWGPRPWNADTHGNAGLCALSEKDDGTSEVSQKSKISFYKRMCIPNELNWGQKNFCTYYVLCSVWTFLHIIKPAKPLKGRHCHCHYHHHHHINIIITNHHYQHHPWCINEENEGWKLNAVSDCSVKCRTQTSSPQAYTATPWDYHGILFPRPSQPDFLPQKCEVCLDVISLLDNEETMTKKG